MFFCRGAHDPAEQARQKAWEVEELKRREEEVVNRITSETLQVLSVSQAIVCVSRCYPLPTSHFNEQIDGDSSGSGWLKVEQMID